MIKQLFFSYLKKAILFSVILYFLHHFLIQKVFTDYYFYYPAYSIYLFLFTITTVIVLLLMVIHKNYTEKTGFAFMAFSVLKMLFSVVFLIPLIKSDLDNKLPDTLGFFLAFFIFLAFETVFVLKMINSNQK